MARYELNHGQWLWTAQHLYGAERLGVDHVLDSVWRDTVSANMHISVLDPICQCWKLQLIRGDSLRHHVRYARAENYELTNHLGNVMAVVTDRSFVHVSGAFATAEVVTATDYYPFGMEMPGRVYNSSAYDYGFNGKIEDSEILPNGRWQDYGFRAYRNDICRFVSVDPLKAQYPWNSVYAFAENDVIRCIDLDGLEKYIITTSINGINQVTVVSYTNVLTANGSSLAWAGLVPSIPQNYVLRINVNRCGISTQTTSASLTTIEQQALIANTPKTDKLQYIVPNSNSTQSTVTAGQHNITIFTQPAPPIPMLDVVGQGPTKESKDNTSTELKVNFVAGDPIYSTQADQDVVRNYQLPSNQRSGTFLKGSTKKTVSTELCLTFNTKRQNLLLANTLLQARFNLVAADLRSQGYKVSSGATYNYNSSDVGPSGNSVIITARTVIKTSEVTTTRTQTPKPCPD